MIPINELLQYEPDPIPRHLIYRDILKLPSDDPRLTEAKKAVLETKHVKDILSLQQSNGSWGFFHSLSMPDQYPMTTEQALRRLRILGLDYNDLPIKKAVQYMEGHLLGELEFPDRKEKVHNWTIFTQLMAAAQIRQFHPASKPAMKIANKWKDIIEYSFSGQGYSQERYEEAYKSVHSLKPKGGRLVDFMNFYPLALLQGLLTEETERKMLDYALSHPQGVYYIHDKCMNSLPASFTSKEANRYLNAVELLSGYKCVKSKLSFVSEWLLDNVGDDGFWDMGPSVRENIVFPLSDSWRKALNRKIDCTVRIISLLDKIGYFV